MEPIVRQTWLSQKPKASASITALLVLAFLFIGSLLSVGGFWNADQWMPASFKAVFVDHQYWRLWTALFAHADLGHLLSNAIVFVPFAYLLSGYFSLWLFPVAALAMGGLLNAVVLMTMAPDQSLIGFSGVVHWMGATYLTLYLLIERTESFRRRIAKVVMISVLLSAPETFQPEVSYFSHLVGYLMGVGSALLYFLVNKNRFRAAEVVEYPEEFQHFVDLQKKFTDKRESPRRKSDSFQSRALGFTFFRSRLSRRTGFGLPQGLTLHLYSATGSSESQSRIGGGNPRIRNRSRDRRRSFGTFERQ